MSARAPRTARLFAFLGSLLVSLSGRFATATATATATSTNTATSRVVRVFVAGDARTVARTRATVRELCARLDLDVVVLEGSDESVLGGASSGTFADAFIDYRRENAARVVVIQGSTRQELERRTLPAAGSVELTVEEAAHVLYAVVESSLRARDTSARETQGGQPGDTAAAPHEAPSSSGAVPATAAATPAAPAKPDTPTGRSAEKPEPVAAALRPAPPPMADTATRAPEDRSASTAAPPSLAAGLSVFGSASVLEGFRPLPGMGGALDLTAPLGPVRFGGTILGGASFSSDVTRVAGDATLRATFGRAFATVEWPSSRRSALLSGLGGGIDRIAVEASAAPPRIQSTGAETRIDPVVACLAGARIGIAGPVSLVTALFVDVDLTPHRYVVASASGHTELFELGRVHASVFAGLSVALSDASRASGASAAQQGER